MSFLSIGKFAGESFGQNVHNNWEIIYYIEGEGLTVVGEESVEFSKGTIVIIPPHIVHSEICSSEYSNYFVAAVDLPFSEDNIIVYSNYDYEQIECLLRLLYLQYNMNMHNREEITNALFTAFIGYIKGLSHTSTNKYVDYLQHKIIDNISNPYFNLTDEIKKMPVTAAYVRKLFNQICEETPVKYLIKKRLEYACEMLRSMYPRFISIKEIAEKSGFLDPYYFTRVFTNHYGVSPSTFVRLENMGQHPSKSQETE